MPVLLVGFVALVLLTRRGGDFLGVAYAFLCGSVSSVAPWLCEQMGFKVKDFSLTEAQSHGEKRFCVTIET